MKETASDLERISKLTPSLIARYMQSTGWTLAKKFDDYENWQITHEKQVIVSLVPFNSTYRDYQERLRDTVALIAAVENRTITQVLFDLENFDNDVLQVRFLREGVSVGEFPVALLGRLFDSIEEMTFIVCAYHQWKQNEPLNSRLSHSFLQSTLPNNFLTPSVWREIQKIKIVSEKPEPNALTLVCPFKTTETLFGGLESSSVLASLTMQLRELKAKGERLANQTSSRVFQNGSTGVPELPRSLWKLLSQLDQGEEIQFQLKLAKIASVQDKRETQISFSLSDRGWLEKFILEDAEMYPNELNNIVGKVTGFKQLSETKWDAVVQHGSGKTFLPVETKLFEELSSSIEQGNEVYVKESFGRVSWHVLSRSPKPSDVTSS